MTYLINEIFASIQGEGVNSGRAAVFVRFARCNLWTGREEDRAGAVCTFCDTDFTAAERLTLAEIVARVEDCAPAGGNRMVVFTGGEPTLQLDAGLSRALSNRGYYIALETNGTRSIDFALDWVCVSPKANAELVTHKGGELKLVYPQPLAPPERFEGLAFKTFWLSPMDGPNLAENTAMAFDYVLAHPRWRLNVQTHKMIGVR